jgi:hypothetical protein
MDTKPQRRDTAAALFEAIWDRLAGVLGASTTAVLMRRATGAAAAADPGGNDHRGVVVLREDFDYLVVIPPSWERSDPRSIDALKRLIEGELAPLLDALTGPIAVDLLLDEVPELGAYGILADRRRRR